MALTNAYCTLAELKASLAITDSVDDTPLEAARIKEFYARLLCTSGEKVIETVLRKAMDDTDKDQVACLKMCIDRLLPISHFEKDKAGRSNAIQVQIVTTGTPKIATESLNYEVIDVDSEEQENG